MPLTETQIKLFENELLARPVRPGCFRCAGCRWTYPNEDRHVLFDVCEACGIEEIDRLLLDLRGSDTRANRRAALVALALLAAESQEKRRARRRKRTLKAV